MSAGEHISVDLSVARITLLAIFAAVMYLVVAVAAVQAAQPPLLRQFCNTGSAAGQCWFPRGVAVDQTSGDVYVADQNGQRIEKFTAWGDFLRSWGWDVVGSGPGDSGTGFEICVPAEGDVCKGGVAGTAPGQFGDSLAGGLSGGGPQGLALDSSGDLYVIDWSNRRVQKFGPDGEFLLAVGGDVNKTKVEEIGSTEAQRNRCPVDPGDICQAGTEGEGKGQFGNWNLGSYVGIFSNGTLTSSDDTIYVGDQKRIQEFNSEGEYAGDLPDPDEVLEKEGTVNSLAVDPLSGALYVGFFNLGAVESKPNVHKLGPAGEEECTISAHDPTGITVDPTGKVYVVDGAMTLFPPFPREISSFDSNCGGKQPLFPREGPNTKGSEDQFSSNAGGLNPTAIATSSACAIEGADLFISNPDQQDSFVKLFGPPPQDFSPPCNAPAEVPPSIEASYATSVTSDGATVRAQIDPHFWPDTTYYVDYATRACIESGDWSSPCVEQQPATPQLLTESVSSGALTTKAIFLGAAEALSPDTDYRFRFIAQSSGGGPVQGDEAAFHTYPLPASAKTDCPNQAFRSAASAPLPDCRAYEMVSPVQKGGGEPLPPREVPNAVQQAAADGDAFTFASTIAFGAQQGASLYNQYISQRDPDGWSTSSINAPRTSRGLLEHEELLPRFKLFSDDLCSGWLLQDTDLPLVQGQVPSQVANLYRRGGLRPGCSGDSAYELLSTVSPPGYGSEGTEYEKVRHSSEYYPTIQGFSADGAISVFRASAKLSQDACDVTNELPQQGPHAKGIYQTYLSQGGTPGIAPKLVSVLPNGEANCTQSSVGTPTGGLIDNSVYHAVSADGSRVYWTATSQATHPTNTVEAGLFPGRLYLRLDATQPQSAFTKKGKCSEPEAACTLAVSKEAEAASETNESTFLSAATDGSAAIFQTGESLWEFDLAQALAGKSADTLIATKVKGILGASSDASRVYLVSSANLAPGGEVGRASLYLYQRGAGITFIAALAPGAELTDADTLASTFPSLHTGRVSPDGLHAAFTSADPGLAQSVAGFDNTDAASGQPDQEVYFYDAEADEGQGRLLCASCNPSGARPVGRETTRGSNGAPGIWSAARIPGWVSETDPGNLLSADGSRLFFESFEALLPRDANGAADVYEWEQASSKEECIDQIGGELYEPATEGCLSLISSGQGPSDAELIDASADGRDVFFLTASSLLPQDISSADIYDARALGGFPAPQAPPPACEGEACQSPPAAPDDPTPASSSFQGAGNVVEEGGTKCKKGKVRHRGRCVKKSHRPAKPTHGRTAGRTRGGAK